MQLLQLLQQSRLSQMRRQLPALARVQVQRHAAVLARARALPAFRAPLCRCRPAANRPF
jgi:hypothetical protein